MSADIIPFPDAGKLAKLRSTCEALAAKHRRNARRVGQAEYLNTKYESWAEAFDQVIMWIDGTEPIDDADPT